LPCLPVFAAGYSDEFQDINLYDTYPARLCSVVDSVLSKNFKQTLGGEAITSGNIDIHIKNLIELVQEFEDSCSDFDLDRNDSGMTVYFKKLLIMIGEEKDLESKLEDAEKQLDRYFDYWITVYQIIECRTCCTSYLPLVSCHLLWLMQQPVQNCNFIIIIRAII
jgi:hypothetical protein